MPVFPDFKVPSPSLWKILSRDSTALMFVRKFMAPQTNQMIALLGATASRFTTDQNDKQSVEAVF